jgi:hypothetical protein
MKDLKNPIKVRYLFLIAGILMLAAGSSQAVPITLQNATATFSQAAFPVGASIDGSLAANDGWAIDPNEVNQTAVWESSTDFGFASGTLLTFTLVQTQGVQHTLGNFRLSATTDNRANFADGLSSGGDVTALWTVLLPQTAMSLNGATLTVQGDQSILASGTSPNIDIYTITAITNLVNITGIRLEAIENASLVTGGPNGSGPGRQPSNGNFVLTEISLDATESATPVPEPATLSLFSLGLLGFVALRRKPANNKNG